MECLFTSAAKHQPEAQQCSRRLSLIQQLGRCFFTSEWRMNMQLGMIGLGRMGANMVQRLMQGGHECVVFDVNPASVSKLANDGAIGAKSLEVKAATRCLADGACRGGR